MVRPLVRRVSTLMAVGICTLTLISSVGAAASAASTAVVSSRDDTKLGPILVARTTVYTLRPGTTACTASCLHDWPPLLLPRAVKTVTAGSGVDASKLGTVATAAGRLQVTYAGKRLYTSAKDKKAGQVHGNVHTRWGTWSTVAVSASAAATPGTTPAPTTAPAADGTTHPSGDAATSPSETAPAATAPPATVPPATAPPATPPTDPPATQPPATTAPGNGGIGF